MQIELIAQKFKQNTTTFTFFENLFKNIDWLCSMTTVKF